MTVSSLLDYDIRQKRVLIRVDFNVPLSEGRVVDDTRIKNSLNTIQYALNQQARVMLCSHLGRPQEGQWDALYSLELIAVQLQKLLGIDVPVIRDWENSEAPEPGQVVLWDNVRFNPGEMANDQSLSQAMAQQCDIFVMDAFATAHRAHASTVGVIEAAPIATTGLLMQSELKALSTALEQPKRPVVAIVGGAKVSTKILLLEALLEQVDVLIVGGGIANTFLKAKGHAIGSSLYEERYVELAQQILATAAEKKVKMPLPQDVATAKEFCASAKATVTTVEAVPDDQMILDIGPATQKDYAEIMSTAGTILWNGPVGVFEFSAFADGTRCLAEAVAQSSAYSIAGGGDTLAALSEFNLFEDMSYVSTGGGAFLQYLQDGCLPAVTAIKEKEKNYVE
jgi:phosphoglycerate kinase